MRQRPPFVEAWIAKRFDEAYRIAEEAGPEDPFAPAYNAICQLHQAEAQQRPLTDIKEACELALRVPPSDAWLHQYVLRVAIHLAIHEDRLDDADAYLQQARDNARNSNDPAVRRVVHQLAYIVAGSRDDYAGQLRAVREGLADLDDPDDVMAIYYRIWRLRAACEFHDLDLAQADVEALGKRRDQLTAHGLMAYPMYEVPLLRLRGEYGQALQRISELTEEEKATARNWAWYNQATSLIYLYRVDEAAVIVEKMAQQARNTSGPSTDNRHFGSRAQIQSLQTILALGRGDLETAWALADELARTAANEHPHWKKQTKNLLIEVALAQRNSALVGRLLTAIDPERSHPAYRMNWARLHWLNGEHDTAAHIFAGLLHRARNHPGYIPAELRFASELSAADTARLHRLARQFDDLDLARSSREAIERRDHPTLARRDRILALFRTHSRLTRAQVIEQIGCAANTATRDLAALQAEGHIERHNTSNHPRTAYFTYRDRGTGQSVGHDRDRSKASAESK